MMHGKHTQNVGFTETKEVSMMKAWFYNTIAKFNTLKRDIQ